MSMLSRLTVTPLLYACGVLLLACAGLGVALVIVGSRLDAAQADVRAAQADTGKSIVERDSWKNTALGGADANRAANEAIDSLMQTLAKQQATCRSMGEANTAAIAAARAEAADADRTLKAFAERFQAESRKPECGAALASLDALCPAMKGY